MKNKFRKFERHFKMEKNGAFHFVISFAAFEILTMLYYANKITDDVTVFPQRGAKAQNEECLSANKRAAQFKLCTCVVS